MGMSDSVTLVNCAVARPTPTPYTNSGMTSRTPVTDVLNSSVVAKIPTASKAIPRLTVRRGPKRRARVAATGAAKKAPTASDRKNQAGLEGGEPECCLEEERQHEQQPELAQRDDGAGQVAVTEGRKAPQVEVEHEELAGTLAAQLDPGEQAECQDAEADGEGDVRMSSRGHVQPITSKCCLGVHQP